MSDDVWRERALDAEEGYRRLEGERDQLRAVVEAVRVMWDNITAVDADGTSMQFPTVPHYDAIDQGLDASGPTGERSPSCCGADMFWCPRVGRMECPTHGGFKVCCDRPDRHTALVDFEPQAKAILKWWMDERHEALHEVLNIKPEDT